MKSIQSEIDKRILSLIDFLISEGKVDNTVSFCNEIGAFKQSITNIRGKGRHFTHSHIYQICKVYGIDANYIYGLSKNKYAKIRLS